MSREGQLNRNRFGHRSRPLVISLVLVGIAIAAAVSFLFNPPAIAQANTTRTLTVTGRGVEMIPTTLAQIRLGVEVTGTTATQVQQQVAERTSAVVELLGARNVEQLQTTGIQLQPQYDFSDRQRRLVGYVGRNIVSFRLPTERMGNLLDAAVQAGATRIDGVSFTASQSAITTAQQAALRAATEDAQRQADTVLETLNLNRQAVVGIQINAAVPSPPIRFEAAQVRSAAEAATPVIGGEQSVEATVTLEIGY